MNPNPNQSQDQMQVEETIQPRKTTRRGLLGAGGGIAAVAVLGGAAYVASQMLNQSKPQAGAGGGQMILQGGAPGAGAQMREFKMPKIKRAPDLPASAPDLTGLYLRRQDNSLFIGTGNVTLAIPPAGASGGQMSAKTDGPMVEVVITRNTQIYKDTTPITFEAIELGKEIQQKVELIGSLDELADQLDEASGLTVWGTRNGDRYIAQMVLYRPPVMISAPPSK